MDLASLQKFNGTQLVNRMKWLQQRQHQIDARRRLVSDYRASLERVMETEINGKLLAKYSHNFAVAHTLDKAWDAVQAEQMRCWAILCHAPSAWTAVPDVS